MKRGCRTDQIWDQTSGADGLDGLLRRLRLLLAMNDRDVGDVDLQKIIPSSPAPQTRHGLDERHALDVSNGASQLNDAHIGLLACIVDRYAGDALDPFLDGVGDVGHDLHGFAQVVALAFPLDNVRVDLAGGDVVLARQGDVEVALVVAQVEVDFAAVGEDEDFAVPGIPLSACGLQQRRGWQRGGVLPGVHGARVDIEIGVDLDARDVLWVSAGADASESKHLSSILSS